ncbi:hypothetical protein BV25DRAFT_1992943 [Artomyces pyxidatus]|uniref:Uncharacterized protein n=1 Tax=Artomyces pyxidatus TaxID=48021 RepID=A0ACB8SW44_9AGAM|nr:hypothetical protein BV25DRAFT_1992943 [Artomyces pyxidatus]
MATLRPPSSPSPSASPAPGANGKPANSRASMGPSGRPSAGAQGFNLASPRPGGGPPTGRPTSELLGSATFQTPEADAIDQWFENFHHYEVTLEEMAAASLDVNFKEELSAIEQWFKVLSEAERTAALYSLLQHSTQVQIRFFITVLQQMARADPMTALLSPAVGGSMQNQMEAKLASMSLKSPGFKSPVPGSPSARTFSAGANANRQSLAFESSGTSFLTPEAANNINGSGDAAATLAQQRAKLKANNAAHRISAPALASSGDGRGAWGTGSSSLGQVAERAASPTQEVVVEPTKSRPQSTDFSGMAASASFRSPRPEGLDALSPVGNDSWASMVNTPLMPMFQKPNNNGQTIDAAAAKLNEWDGGRVPLMGDAKQFRRASKGNASASDTGSQSNGVYGDDGDLISAQQQQQQQQQQPARQQGQGQRNPARNLNAGNNAFGPGGWSGARSPALSNVSSGRFGSDDGGLAGLGMGGFNLGMGSPGLGMGLPNGNGLGMAGLAGMGQINPFNMNMNMLNMANLSAMGISPEAQLLAAQMAASNFGQPGMNPLFGLQQQAAAAAANQRNQPRGGGRSPGLRSNPGRDQVAKKDEEDFDPQVLGDVPGWLRTLRLHKYTPNFEGMNWKDMVMMDEAALERQGVAALGARRKMLKTFEVVRKKMGIEDPAGGSSSPTASS